MSRYVLDFTNTLDGGKAAVITDTVTQAGEYLYSDMDPFTFAMVEQQAARIAELEADYQRLMDKHNALHINAQEARTERDTLRAELETERMRLVACGVVAMANTAESAAKVRDMHPDYLCASVRDVAAAVDREMALRAEVERLRKPLTDEQILHRVDTHVGEANPSYPLGPADWINFARAIEAAKEAK